MLKGFHFSLSVGSGRECRVPPEFSISLLFIQTFDISKQKGMVVSNGIDLTNDVPMNDVPVREVPRTETSDTSDIAYTQELHRGLGFVGTFATAFAQQGVMASTTLLFGYGLRNGGPAVMLYVWLVGSLLACITGACLAEICSKFPYAGSVYHWAGKLAPPGHAPIASYWTGWLNLLGKRYQ